MATIPVPPSPSAQPSETAEARFRRLAAAWEQATAHLSSMTAASRHPAYQEIIGLGPAVVPFLLRDLQDNETHWFGALRAITGANPVPPSAAGDVPRMVEAWLQWARDQGYRW
jgi:hypothetical protein